MANPWRGEVPLELEGGVVALRLTLGALAELEAELGTGSLAELVERFEGGSYAARDILALLRAGMRGAGADAERLTGETVVGGPLEAARVAARLLSVTFAVPE